MRTRPGRNHRKEKAPIPAFGLLSFILLLTVVSVPFGVVAAQQEGGHGESGEVHGETVNHGGDADGADAHEGEAHGEDAHADDHGGGISTHMPNIIGELYKATDHAPVFAFLHEFENVFFSLLVITFMSFVAGRVYRNRSKIPGPLQNVVELMVESMANFVEGILGREDGRRYVPFLGTLFFYILFMNFFGLIPLMHSPTSAFNTTFALAVWVFLVVQISGVIRLGPLGYLYHLAGEPKGVIGWIMVVIMLPLHLVGEFAKPVSLSLRLFGNVMGEDTLLAVFLALGVMLLHFLVGPVPAALPLHFIFIFLALLTSTIQALVFTLLSTIYISQVLPHHHDEEHEGEHETAGPDVPRPVEQAIG